MGLIIHRRAGNPAAYGTLEHWYTFRGADITIDTEISNVDDRVASDDLAQATAGYQPADNSSGINSLPTADHDGSDDTLVSSVFTTLSEPYTVAVAFALNNVDGSGTAVVGDGQTNFEFGHNGTNWVLTGDGGGTSLTSSTAADTSDHYAVCRMLGTASTELRIDGATDTTGDAGTGSISKIVTADSRFATFANVKIGEILVYDNDVSGASLTDLETYLARWVP